MGSKTEEKPLSAGDGGTRAYHINLRSKGPSCKGGSTECFRRLYPSES